MKRERATKTSRNNLLEEAMALLIQTQASFVQNQVSFVSQMAELNRVSSERFARIEEELASIRAILLRHEQILQGLPETIREKIGFKTATQKSPPSFPAPRLVDRYPFLLERRGGDGGSASG